MKLIVGIGNPGERYKSNRHNVGQMMIDYIGDQVKSEKFNPSADGQNYNLKLKTFKTDGFMNESGKFVKKVIENYKLKIENLVIVHDDLDIPLGKFRIDFGKGPRLHNGLKSIEQTLKTKDFWRIRIGVDNRQKIGWVDGETYVLQDFSEKEQELLKETFAKIFKQLITVLI